MVKALSKYFVYVFIILPSICFANQDWEVLLQHLSHSNPGLAAQWEKAKKDAEKQEKDLKENADKYFQSSFDQVFGKDNFKPSDGLEMMKIIEAASAGELDTAGKAANEMLIAAYMPGLGQYISVLKQAASAIKSAEQKWAEGLNDTQAYHNFLRIFSKQKTGRTPYIPSYMITYLRSNKHYGTQIKAIYQDMRQREDLMYKRWLEDEAAIDQMLLPGWASRWISARGKVPTQREMFNYFLYQKVKDQKPRYMQKFGDEYIRPLIRQEAAKQRQRLQQAAQMGVAGYQQAVDRNSQDQQGASCPQLKTQLANAHQDVEKAKKDLFANYKSLTSSYQAKLNRALNAEAARADAIWHPFRKQEKELKAEDDKLTEELNKLRSIQSRLDTIVAKFNRLKSQYQSSNDKTEKQSLVPRIKSLQQQHKTIVANEQKPLQDQIKPRYDAFQAKLAAFKQKQERQRNNMPAKTQSPAVRRGFKATYKAMKVLDKSYRSCEQVSQAMLADNVQGQYGFDPGISSQLCQALLANYNKKAALQKSIATQKCPK